MWLLTSLCCVCLQPETPKPSESAMKELKGILVRECSYFISFSLYWQALLWNFCILVWSHRAVLEQILQFHLWFWFDLRIGFSLARGIYFCTLLWVCVLLPLEGILWSVSAIDSLETSQILTVGMLRDGEAAVLIQSKAPGLHIEYMWSCPHQLVSFLWHQISC